MRNFIIKRSNGKAFHKIRKSVTQLVSTVFLVSPPAIRASQSQQVPSLVLVPHVIDMMACYDQKSLEDFTGLPTAIHPDKRDEYRRKVLLTLERVERLKMAVDSSHALPDIMAAHGDGQEDLDMLVAILRIIHPFRGGIDQTGLLTAAPHLPVPYLERNLWTIVELLDLGIDLASRSPSDRGIQPLIIKLCSWSDRYMVGLRWANIDAVRQGLICTGEAPCLPFTYESNGNPVTISSIYFILHRLASNSRFPQIEPVIPVTGAPIIFLS